MITSHLKAFHNCAFDHYGTTAVTTKYLSSKSHSIAIIEDISTYKKWFSNHIVVLARYFAIFFRLCEHIIEGSLSSLYMKLVQMWKREPPKITGY